MMPGTRRHWWLRKFLLAANPLALLALAVTRFEQPWLIAVALLTHGAFVYAIVRPSCAWFGPVVTRFEPRGSEVWLTIDDGPAGRSTEELASKLTSLGVRATFFIKGDRLATQPATARRLLEAGHTLANHTHTHPAGNFWWLRPAALRREIDACNNALRDAGVAVTRWFRAPVGLKHARLHPALAARGMRLVAWSVRGGDGLGCDPEAVASRVAGQVHPGAIVLLHEGRPRSNEAILRAVEAVQQLGYSFVIPSDEQLA